MRLRRLYTDDDAVSPVIGVILMVAITVILAAVITSIVLGIGQNAAQRTPQASFSFEFVDSDNDDAGYVKITHNGGDAVQARDLHLRGRLGRSSYDSDDDRSGSSRDLGVGGDPVDVAWSANAYGGTSEVGAGDYAYAPADSEYDVQVVYEPPNSGKSVTLSRSTGPDAP